MAEALKQKGATVAGSYFTKGKSFVVVNIGHPGKDDLEGARAFAREMARQGLMPGALPAIRLNLSTTYKVKVCHKYCITRGVATPVSWPTPSPTALGVKATDVNVASVDPAAGVIFLGSGCYGGKPGEDMAKFIETQDLQRPEGSAVQHLRRGCRQEIGAMADALNRQRCNGTGKLSPAKASSVIMNRGRPNATDLEAAKQFARETVKNG